MCRGNGNKSFEHGMWLIQFWVLFSLEQANKTKLHFNDAILFPNSQRFHCHPQTVSVRHRQSTSHTPPQVLQTPQTLQTRCVAAQRRKQSIAALSYHRGLYNNMVARPRTSATDSGNLQVQQPPCGGYCPACNHPNLVLGCLRERPADIL